MGGEKTTARCTSRGCSMHEKEEVDEHGLFSFCMRFAYKMTDWVVDGWRCTDTDD